MILDLSAWGRSLAQRFGDRPAAVSEGESLSFQQLDASAEQWAAALLASGIGPGSHVGLLAGNSPTWLAVALGVWRAGATLVPLSTFVTARELRETLVHADVDTLILQPQLGSHRHLDALRGIRDTLTSLRQVVVLGTAGATEI